LAILVGKKLEKIMQIQTKCKQQKICQKIEITNFKEKWTFQMSINLKLILIIPTSNLFENFKVLIFEIIINLIQFFQKSKINNNDVADFVLWCIFTILQT
jgi:hypothetical protein